MCSTTSDTLVVLDVEVPPTTLFKAVVGPLQWPCSKPFPLGETLFLSLVFHLLVSLKGPGIRHWVSSGYLPQPPMSVVTTHWVPWSVLGPPWVLGMSSTTDLGPSSLFLIHGNGIVHTFCLPLGCLLKNLWPLHLVPYSRASKLTHICSQTWPQYPLDNQSKWLPNAPPIPILLGTFTTTVSGWENRRHFFFSSECSKPPLLLLFPELPFTI